MRDYKDQTCTRCGLKVTAKELRKGAPEHYEYLLIDLDRSTHTRHLLCVGCRVNQDKFYKMERLLPEHKKTA